MKWEWVALVYVLQTICCLDVGTSSEPVNPNKNLSKGRHKTSRIAAHPTETPIDIEDLHEILESYFPDVIYPTSILEVVQPFYYSYQGYDDVLGPFSNDIKSSYKSLTSGRGKLPATNNSLLSIDHKNETVINEPSNNYEASKSNTTMELYDNSQVQDGNVPDKLEQNNDYLIINETMLSNDSLYTKNQHYINQEVQLQDLLDIVNNINGDILNNETNNLQTEQLENNHTIFESMEIQLPYDISKENLLETFDAKNGSKSYQENVTSNYFSTHGISNNQENIEQLHTNNSNKTYHADITPNYNVTVNPSNNQKDEEALDPINNNDTSYKNVSQNYNILSDGSNIQDNTEWIDVWINNKTYSKNTTSNYFVISDVSNTQNITEMSETGNTSYYVNVTPNFVLSSDTGNTREDFVSDIKNIYSLIEETLRAE